MTSQSHSLPVTCFLLLIVCVCVCVLCLSRSLNTCIMWLVGWKRKTIEWSATSTRALSKTFFFSLALYSSSFQIWGLYWNDTFVFSLSLSVSISFCLRQIVQCIWSEYCNWLLTFQADTVELELVSYSLGRCSWAQHGDVTCPLFQKTACLLCGETTARRTHDLYPPEGWARKNH